MAPIPVPLIWSNSSTMLAWICAYVPHEILLFLLAFALFAIIISSASLLFLLAKGCAWLYAEVFTQQKSPPLRRLSPWSPPNRPLPKQPLFYHPNPTLPHPFQCPQCLFEINPAAVPHSSHVPNPRTWMPLQIRTPDPLPAIRRASDVTPTNYDFASIDEYSPESEPSITTPPRKAVDPPKAPVRRSPRPRKPRKFSF